MTAPTDDERDAPDEAATQGTVDEVDEVDERPPTSDARSTSGRARAEARARDRRRTNRKPKRERAAIDLGAAARARKRRERIVRGMLVLAAALAAAGIAIVGTRESGLGAVLVVAGMLLLIGGIHSFGRLGPDESA